MKKGDRVNDLRSGAIVEVAANSKRSMQDELGQVDQKMAQCRFVEERTEGRQPARFRRDQENAGIGRVRGVDAASLVNLGALSLREGGALVERIAHRLRLEFLFRCGATGLRERNRRRGMQKVVQQMRRFQQIANAREARLVVARQCQFQRCSRRIEHANTQQLCHLLLAAGTRKATVKDDHQIHRLANQFEMFGQRRIRVTAASPSARKRSSLPCRPFKFLRANEPVIVGRATYARTGTTIRAAISWFSQFVAASSRRPSW